MQQRMFLSQHQHRISTGTRVHNQEHYMGFNILMIFYRLISILQQCNVHTPMNGVMILRCFLEAYDAYHKDINTT